MTILLALILFHSRDDDVIWAVAGAGAGVYLFYRGFRMLQRKRLILDTPTSKIRSASMGLVEVSGEAIGPYIMTAPVTDLPCYYYRAMVWQLKQSGRSRSWKKVVDESLHLPFYLDDNTGRVLVNPQHAEMDIHRDFHEEYSDSIFSSSSDVPDNVRGFLARHGVGTDKKIKVEEHCIKPQDTLFILGTLAENPGLEVSPSPVRTISSDMHKFTLQLPGVTTSRTVSLAAADADAIPQEVTRPPADSAPPSPVDMAQQEKIIVALMRAGISNPAAWAAAGVQYPGVPVRGAHSGSEAAAAATEEAFDLNPPVVLMKGSHNALFFISWRSQRDVVTSLGWKSTLMIWGGPALTLLCVYLLLARFGWL